MCKNLDEEAAVDKLINLLYTTIDSSPYIGIGLGNKPVGKLTKEDFILPKKGENIILTTEAPKMKYCSVHKMEHPISDFNRDVTTKDGYRRICRAAQREQTKAKKEGYRITKKEYGVLLRFDLAGESGKALCTELKKEAEANRRTLENHIIFILENLPKKV